MQTGSGLDHNHTSRIIFINWYTMIPSSAKAGLSAVVTLNTPSSLPDSRHALHLLTWTVACAYLCPFVSAVPANFILPMVSHLPKPKPPSFELV